MPLQKLLPIHPRWIQMFQSIWTDFNGFRWIVHLKPPFSHVLLCSLRFWFFCNMYDMFLNAIRRFILHYAISPTDTLKRYTVTLCAVLSAGSSWSLTMAILRTSNFTRLKAYSFLFLLCFCDKFGWTDTLQMLVPGLTQPFGTIGTIGPIRLWTQSRSALSRSEQDSLVTVKNSVWNSEMNIWSICSTVDLTALGL
jgi:hypothetical protein